MSEKPVHIRKRIIRTFANKYVFFGLLFFIWIGFFDNNSLVHKRELKKELKELKKEKAYYEQEIQETERKTEELLSSRDNLEKFAREQYLMKKSNEDIFIIVDKNKRGKNNSH